MTQSAIHRATAATARAGCIKPCGEGSASTPTANKGPENSAAVWVMFLTPFINRADRLAIPPETPCSVVCVRMASPQRENKNSKDEQDASAPDGGGDPMPQLFHGLLLVIVELLHDDLVRWDSECQESVFDGV